jgi:hypothetical protein
MLRRMTILIAALVLTSCVVWSQDSQNQSTPGTDMSGHDMSKMSGHADGKEMSGEDAASQAPVMHSMEGHHMDMGPHMKMTELRPLKPGDEERAEKVVEAARRVAEKYKDYHTALNDGFQIFLPNVPQKTYHFTNYGYGWEASFGFNPEHPTSLLYEKHGDDYKLVGVMYTAPKRFTEDDLDQRIPLSVAQWHEHVNFCAPPTPLKLEPLAPNPKFGFRGSISTKEECEANGGTFKPLVFNWMVHVYPLEKTEAEIWAVDRDHEHGRGN